MKNLSLRDYEMPSQVKWFQEFLDHDLESLETGHPLKSYIESYNQWQISKFGTVGVPAAEIPVEVIEFGTFITGIQLFRDQLKDKVKRQFVSDLLDERTCYGVLFEVTVLINCWRLEYENLTYRSNRVNGKEPDIMFTNPDLRRIFIECTRKYAKPSRTCDDDALIEDLKRSIKTKGESYEGLEVPLIFAVHVPEEVSLNRNEFRTKLGHQVQEMFKDRIFHNVNWVIFSSYRPPLVARTDSRGNRVYNTDLISLRYPNPNVDASLEVRMYFGPAP